MATPLIQHFSQLTLTIGRVTPQGVNMLGTGFLINDSGFIATTFHVVGNDSTNLVILMPSKKPVNEYQDLSNLQCEYTTAEVSEIDPTKDIAILKASMNFSFPLPALSNLDGVNLGAKVDIYGFPHCIHGRRSFTYQTAEIGAKVLIDNHGIKSKHAVINIQARPGQSGSPIVLSENNAIIGMVIGAWVPEGAGIRLGDINPYELHQTTHCISADHIMEMF